MQDHERSGSAHERYQLLSSFTTDIILFSDRTSLRILEVNDAAIAAYGYARDEFLTLDIATLRAPHTRSSIAQMVARTDVEAGATFETVHMRKNGSTFPVEVRARSAPFGTETVIISTIRDISERLAAAHDVARLTELWKLSSASDAPESAQLHAMLEAAARSIHPDVAFLGSLGAIEGDEFVTEAVAFASGDTPPTDFAQHIFVPGSRAPLAGSIAERLQQRGQTLAWSDATPDEAAARPAMAARNGFRTGIGTPVSVGGTTHFLLFLSTVPVMTAFRPEDASFVELLASFFAARMQNSRLRNQLRFQIEHDALTGLPNRPLFRGAVNRAIQEDGSAIVVIVDIDRFRELNETLGHQTADAILVEIGAALAREVRSDEMVARLGGDNFGMFVRRQYDPVAGKRLERLQRLFREPFGIGDRNRELTVRVSATFGVAMAPEDGTTFEELLSGADAAVEVAKTRDRGGVTFFNPEIGRSVGERRKLHAELQGALAFERFEMYYQPTVSLSTSAVTGAEALIRWHHPTRGLLLPDAFIEFAERNGIIREIGTWVMERTIADVARMVDLPFNFRCYFNVSIHQLSDPDFVRSLRNVLAANEGARGRIGIEITERAAMLDVHRTLESLAELRALDVRVAIDDFGTGYSSLAYLRQFDVDVIKIDRSFIREVDKSERDAALVSTLLNITAGFGCMAVAEGVESEGERDWLRENGCDMAQGYLIAQPMPLDRFRDWIAAPTSRSSG